MDSNELALRLTELAIDYPNDDWLGLNPDERVDQILSLYQTFQRRLGEAQPQESRATDQSIIIAENLNPDDIQAA